MAEDLIPLRDGLIHMLEAYDFEVVAAVSTGPDLLRALLEQRHDVAVVDVRLPPTQTDEGLRAALAARAEIPGLRVLVLSQYVERLYARELLADGGRSGRHAAGAHARRVHDDIRVGDLLQGALRLPGGASRFRPGLATQ